MTDSFFDLPHIAGIINDPKDSRVVSRALSALQGELHRREHILKAHNAYSIDEYNETYYSDPAQIRLPHLVVVVDTSDRLEKEQPGSVRELVSMSRSAKTLGVHLIMTTREPSNSVSDEILANSRFHLCLRVQTVADSMEMLRRPDAACIEGMGRCFVQIGNDELFEQVQTSYFGLAYSPDEPRPEEMPQLLNESGQVARCLSNLRKPTQMEAALKRIGEIAQQHGLDHSRQMWLPEMPGKVYFNNLALFTDNHVRDGVYANVPAGVQFLLGLADDTAHQRYIPYVVNLTEIRNLCPWA